MAQNRRAQTALKIGDLAPKKGPGATREYRSAGIRADPGGSGGNFCPSRPAGKFRARVCDGPCLNLKTKDFERLYGLFFAHYHKDEFLLGDTRPVSEERYINGKKTEMGQLE